MHKYVHLPPTPAVRMPNKVFHDRDTQLTRVLTKIFDNSLSQATIPSSLKTAFIIPVPKKLGSTDLNNYRLVALTPIVKSFEKLVLHFISIHLPISFDPHQYGYRANRSTEDAVARATYTALTHLKHLQFYVRMLFINFTYAFNSISSKLEIHSTPMSVHRSTLPVKKSSSETLFPQFSGAIIRRLLIAIYRATIQSILSSCISVSKLLISRQKAHKK